MHKLIYVSVKYVFYTLLAVIDTYLYNVFFANLKINYFVSKIYAFDVVSFGQLGVGNNEGK